MAKRKRLTPAQPKDLDTEMPALETKAFGVARTATRAPIAQVAGDASTAAALQELASEVKRAKDEGRMIQAIPVAQIQSDYLTRDRLVVDDEDLRALIDSIKARGQQTPIEVVQLGEGSYGLISGWRRLSALRQLQADTGEDRFGVVNAILRQPDTAADAYIAMIEENEIRVGLSYYERARAAAKAVQQGVFETEKEALQQLFSTASRSKRSKIGSFLTLYHALDSQLQFAPAIPERLGLALVNSILDVPETAEMFRSGLKRAAASTPEAEIACLESILADAPKDQSLIKARTPVAAKAPARVETPLKGVDMRLTEGKVSLSGPGVTEDFQKRLRDWLAQQI